jgi:hypothetical protein
MSVVISGDGTITGIGAGGLPDGSVTVAELSTGASGTGVGFVYEAGAGYMILQGADGTKVAQCWGVSTGNASAFVTVTFPVTFSSAPNVVASAVADTFATSAFAAVGNVTTTTFQHQAMDSAGANTAADVQWFASGPIA